MQARVGRKWRTFKQLRTDSEGRFRGKYRFTQTVGRVRYVFRALVKRQGGYPYEPGRLRTGARSWSAAEAPRLVRTPTCPALPRGTVHRR